jgi:cytochrome P450
MNVSIFDPAIVADPFPLYRVLREETPVFWDTSVPGGTWLVSRYADVSRALRDPRLSGDRMPLFRVVLRDTPEARAFDDSMARWLLNLEGPTHGRLRSLVSKAFAPRMVEALRPRIQAISNGLLDAVEPAGRMEVMRDFALPLPVTIIAELLGLPLEDVPRLRAWAADVALFFGAMRGIKRAVASEAELRAYLADTLARRRARPGSDLLTALLEAEEDGQRLTEADILATCIMLFIAGHETTTHLIGNGLLALLTHPDQLALVRSDPSRTPSAVEELLRYGGVVPFIARIAREDLEIGGQRIERGQYVILLLASANRDPAAFADPDRLDVQRADNRHLGFGLGVHYCLGAPLARVEAAIAFNGILRRWPRLRLTDQAPVWQKNVGFRGLETLPVAFD